MAVNCEILIYQQSIVNQTSYNPTDELSNEIWNYYMQNKQTREQIRQKCEYRNKLSEILKSKYGQNVELFIVGSTVNGFAAKTSDLDLCFYIERNNSHFIDKKIESKKILDEIFYYFLSKFPFQIKNPEVIRAKVPIFRYWDDKYKFNVEINFNNEIGIRNTRLLYAYNTFDIRVAPLVFIVKQWARIWDIIDAHQGYLSSYNWQLMVIHYLQQCQPPILPSLQLLYQEYFDANENVLKYVDLPQTCFNTVLMENNRQTLGDLLKGFLEYYSNFKYDRNVISIRLGKLIHPNLYSDKWYNVNIGVEEPFSRQNSAYSVYDVHGYNKIVNCLDQSSRILKKENILASLGIILDQVRSKPTRSQRSEFGKTEGSFIDSSVRLSPQDKKLTL